MYWYRTNTVQLKYSSFPNNMPFPGRTISQNMKWMFVLLLRLMLLLWRWRPKVQNDSSKLSARRSRLDKSSVVMGRQAKTATCLRRAAPNTHHYAAAVPKRELWKSQRHNITSPRTTRSHGRQDGRHFARWL